MQKSSEKQPRIIGIIQARMNSTRLPGKVLETIGSKPMLWYVNKRLSLSKCLSSVVVATSVEKSDDPIADFCKKNNIPCFRGSESDVLERFYLAAKDYKADVIVRVTADCPLIDPEVTDKVIREFCKTNVDYASNTEGYSYPEGLDTEVFSFEALEKSWKQAKKSTEREHVTPFIRENAQFKKLSISYEKDLSSEKHHWSVDLPEDLEFVRHIYDQFDYEPDFKLEEVLPLARKITKKKDSHSEVINAGYYRSIFQEAKGNPVPVKKLAKSQEWFNRTKKVIPACAQTFSKSYLQFVQGVAPTFLSHGSGCRVYDVDGNEYIDYMQGLLAQILGYAHPSVTKSVTERISKGHSFSLVNSLEVELAEKLTQIIPCAEMVRFGKNGSDVTAGAIRAARALTNRSNVAVSGYHGWQDWYIGSTTRNAGVPEEVKSLTHTFPYNDLPALDKLFSSQPNKFAAVILEPFNFVEPKEGYLQGLKELTHKHGALLIFDEICSGFHFGLGGAQKLFGVTPDLACFGKAMGNGFPISCVVGKKEYMKVFEDIFFSFTAAGETSAMAAALAVIDVLETTDGLSNISKYGTILKDGFNQMSKEAGLEDYFECVGRPNWSLLKFRDKNKADSYLTRSLFQQELIKRGILQLVTHNMCTAHDASSTAQTLEAYANTFKRMQIYLGDNKPEKYLEGKPIEPIFKVRA